MRNPTESARRVVSPPRTRRQVLVRRIWITLAVLGILGVLGFDGVSIALCHISTQDDANTAARAAAEECETHHDQNSAFVAAKQSAQSHGEVIDGLSINTGTCEVTDVQLRRVATTVVLDKVHRSWVDIAESGSAAPRL